MAKKFNIPIRMCVSCRHRDAQPTMVRLQCINSELRKYIGSGRSFYLCKHCLEVDKKISKILMRQCRSGNKDKYMSKLKEIITDDRKS